MRAIRAIEKAPSAVAGRTRDARPSRPAAGSQPRPTANTMMRRSPSQYTGIACPSRTPIEQTASRRELRRSAARMPAGTATTSASPRPAAVSSIVAGSICRSSPSASRPGWKMRRSSAPALEADLGQADRLVPPRRPLEPVRHPVDVHLLVHEDPGRVVADHAQELAVELLPLFQVHLGPGLLH